MKINLQSSPCTDTCMPQNQVSRISIAVDAWTSLNHQAYIAVTGHWEEDGEARHVLLDFVEVPEVCRHYELVWSQLMMMDI